MLADGGEGRLDVVSAALPEEHESDGAFLRHWAAYRVSPGERLTRSGLADRLAADVARLDDVIGRQLDAILHHPQFQAIESSWRGLEWLVGRADEAIGSDAHSKSANAVRVRLLNCSKGELQARPHPGRGV